MTSTQQPDSISQCLSHLTRLSFSLRHFIISHWHEKGECDKIRHFEWAIPYSYDILLFYDILVSCVASYCCGKHHDPKQSQFIMNGNQGRNLRQESVGRNWNTDPGITLLNSLLIVVYSACLIIQSSTTCPMVAPPTVGWVL